MKRSLVIIFLLFSTSVYSANEYLNSLQHCQIGTFEPYMDYTKGGDEYRPNSESAYDYDNNRVSRTIGIRLRIPFGSTCTKEYRRLVLSNELLRQQLEMLKLCARYKDLVLSDDFAEVRRMCQGVSKPSIPKELPDKGIQLDD